MLPVVAEYCHFVFGPGEVGDCGWAWCAVGGFAVAQAYWAWPRGVCASRCLCFYEG